MLNNRVILGLVGVLFTLLGAWQTSQAATIFVVSNQGNMGSLLASSPYDVDEEITTPGNYRLQSANGEMILHVDEVRPLEAIDALQLSDDVKAALQSYGGSVEIVDGAVVTGQSDLPVRVYLVSTPLPEGPGVQQLGIMTDYIGNSGGTHTEGPTPLISDTQKCIDKADQIARERQTELRDEYRKRHTDISAMCITREDDLFKIFDKTHADCRAKAIFWHCAVCGVACTAGAHAALAFAHAELVKDCPELIAFATDAALQARADAIILHQGAIALCLLGGG